MGPDDFTEFDPPRNGGNLLEPLSGEDAPILPIGEVRSAYLFRDGSFSREITRFAGTVDGRFRSGRLMLDGRYDVHVAGETVFFEKWEYDELGARVGDIEYRLSCAACGGKW